jgi:hypothetical protein
MSIYSAYLLVLALAPLVVRIKWDQRAAMAAVIAGMALAVAIAILMLLASFFVEGIWPHAAPAIPPRKGGGGSFFLEALLFFWTAVAVPVLAALAGGALAVFWTMLVGCAHYAVGAWLRRKKRVVVGSAGD